MAMKPPSPQSRYVTRRRFLRTASGALATLALAGCTGPRGVFAPARPSFGRRPESIDTRWPIKRVVYVMLENRSFDHLFGRFPGANGTSVGVELGRERPLVRCPDWLPGDLPHDRAAAMAQLNDGAMDNFGFGAFGPMYGYSQFAPEDIPSYWHWAENYVLSDNHYASMLGPSYPNHLFFVSGSGGGAIDNPENTRVKHVTVDGQKLHFKSWGCDAYGEDMFVLVEDDHGNVSKHSTCFELPTVGEQLSERDVDWASYSPEPHQPGYIWQGYSAIPGVHGTELWDQHAPPVDDLLMDIGTGSLPSVTWVVPRWQLSDHPPASTCHAMNWVTRIVNGVMESPMWEHTAIFITWDEWGGLYDHVEPPVLNGKRLGFRVPMLVISPYAKRGYVDDGLADFVSPLRFVADNWDLPYLTERYEQVHNYEHVFNFDRRPRRPDPLPLVDCGDSPWEFPDEHPEWPADVEPRIPTFPEERDLPDY